MGFESSVSDLDLALVFAEIAAVSDSPLIRSRSLTLEYGFCGSSPAYK